MDNALWDMFAKSRKKPLWKLVVDMTPVNDICAKCENKTDWILQEEIVSATAFRYITDAITPEEALKMLKEKEATKAEREKHVREVG